MRIMGKDEETEDERQTIFPHRVSIDRLTRLDQDFQVRHWPTYLVNQTVSPIQFHGKGIKECEYLSGGEVPPPMVSVMELLFLQRDRPQ